MHARRRRGITALAVAVGLIAAACGDDDDEGTAASDTTTAEAEATTTSADTEDATTTAGDSGATTSAAGAGTGGGTAGATADNPSGFGTSALVEGGPYGQSPDNEELYVGAGGFEVDLADCPSDYDPVQGITDEEIKLGISLPRSGPLAGFGLTADGMNSYFEYVNQELGGIEGREIVL